MFSGQASTQRKTHRLDTGQKNSRFNITEFNRNSSDIPVDMDVYEIVKNRSRRKSEVWTYFGYLKLMSYRQWDFDNARLQSQTQTQ